MRVKINWYLPITLLLLLVVGFGSQISQVQAQTQPDFCINIGGAQLNAFGMTFLADNASNGNSPYFTTTEKKFGNVGDSATENMLTLANVLLTGSEADIFQTERYGGLNGSTMTLDLGAGNLTAITTDGNLPVGDYILDLYFAEAYVSIKNTAGVGGRVFDVELEGVLILDDFDLFTIPEPDRALAPMVISNPVTIDAINPSITVDFSASADNAKLSAVCVRPLVTDVVPPSISVLGNDTLALAIGDDYVELGATATDNEDNDMVLRVVADSSAVDTSVAGNYDVIYTATDSSGNLVQATRTVTVSETVTDITPPVITLIGADTLELTVGDTYTELGATANDDTDGDISGSIVIDATAVNTSTIGNYQVTYDVSDAAGNAAQVIRDVNVVDNSPIFEPLVDWNSTAGELVAIQTNATDDGSISYSISGAPTGISIDSTGLITGTIDAGAAGTYIDVTVTVDDSVNAPVSQTFNWLVIPAVAEQCTVDNAVAAINLGEGEVTASNGVIFLADTPANLIAINAVLGGTKYAPGSMNGVEIHNTDLDELYRSERYGGAPGAPAMTYDVTVPNGIYVVELYIAEIFTNLGDVATNNDKERIMDVSVEGTTVFENLHLYQQALALNLADGDPSNDTSFGRDYAMPVTRVLVTVTDGVLNMTLSSDFDNGKMSAFCVGLVELANTAPVAANDDATTDEDVAAIINALTNDTDAESVPTIASVGTATNGTVVDNLDGTVTYTPNADFNGSDSFTYTITDGEFTSTASVNVTVNPINDVPVAVDDDAITDEDIAVVISVLLNDTDVDVDSILTVDSVGVAINGAVTFDSTTVTYTPNVDFNGTDSFTYTITDGDLTATASVTVNVGLSNDAPIALDDDATTDEDVAVVINVLLNDTDVDSTPTIDSIGVATNGTVTDNLDGTVTYTPRQDFFGTDTFTYTITDGELTDDAVVTVTVTAVNDIPVVTITDPVSTVAITEGDSITFTAIATDIEDGDLSASLDWSSDLDGALATDLATFDTSTLSVGTHIITADAVDSEAATASATISVIVSEAGVPLALVEITPNGGLGASTYLANSIQVTNNSTGGITIDSVSLDLSTAILPDLVFDPVGAGGDATASCLTANSGAVATGFVVPSNPCTSPFSVARNGGFDVATISFTDFDASEQFFFTVDVDPNSIQGVAGAGNAGAVSGYELVGSTITVTFSDGSIIVASLYEDGSLGGGQAIVTASATNTPSIIAQGLTSPAIVNDLNQTIELTGTPGDYYSLLQMDTRLYIASGDAPFDVTLAELPFYANEAMSGKVIFNGQIDGDGTVEIPVSLLVTASGNISPDGGLNSFIAVTSSVPYAVDQQVSETSNVVTLKYEEPVQNVAPVIDFLTVVSNGIPVEENAQLAVQFSVTDADGNLDTVDITGVDFVSINGSNGIYTATFSPDLDDAGIYNISVTAVDTELATTTASFILTVSEEPLASLTGTFTTQGRIGDYNSLNTMVNLYPVGSNVATYTFNPTTSGISTGTFTLEGIEPGMYQVAVKANGALQVIETITLSTGGNSINFGILPAGDANGDNFVTSLDFSLLASTFNKQEGNTGYNAAADFNNDGLVSSLDFSLLATNFNTSGDIPTETP